MARAHFVIESGGRGMTYRRDDGFTVYRLDVHPSSSVLAGQQRRTFIDHFDTLADAQRAHPTALAIVGTSYQPPDLSHLPDEDHDDGY